MKRAGAFSRTAQSLVCAATAACIISPTLAAEPLVSVVTDAALGPAATHGLEKLTAAIRAKGIECEQVASWDDAHGTLQVAVGLADGDGPASRLLETADYPLPKGPEALAIHRAQWKEKPLWVIAGSDDRGLMYGQLDVADRIGWSDAERKPVRAGPCPPEANLYAFCQSRWV